MDEVGTQQRGHLPYLLDAVQDARELESQQRSMNANASNSVALARARQSTLKALVAYAQALAALNWPVPRSIQSDIRMHRILCRTTPSS